MQPARADSPSTTPRWSVLLAVCLAACPFLYLVALLCRYHLDAPYMDQWEFVLLLEKSYETGVTLGDLWAQHNEHRHIFPRLIMLALARLSHWDIRWELAANLALGVGLFAALIGQLRATARRLVVRGTLWLVPLVSLIVFSLSQWQNWFLGWQLVEFLNVLAVVAGFILVAHPGRGWVRLVAAMAMGIVATYSFGSGLAFWPVGFVGLMLVDLGAGGGSAGPAVSHSRARWGVWLAASCLVVASYAYGYEPPDYHPPMRLAFAHPLEYATYILTYIGGPVVAYNGAGAPIAGAAGLVLLGALTGLLVRWHAVPLAALAPYLCMGLYAAAAAAVTGLGRVGFSADQALSSRYVTMAQLLWVSNVVLAYLLASRLRLDARGTMTRWGFAAAMVLLGLLVAVNSVYGTLKWTERYAYRFPARAELLAGNDPELLRRLHPNVEIVKERCEVLRNHGLSVFRP